MKFLKRSKEALAGERMTTSPGRALRRASATAAARSSVSTMGSAAGSYPGAAWAAAEGIVSGYGDGRFGPNDLITREQLAVMLWQYAKSLGMNTSGQASLSGFADAGEVSSWAEEALSWSVKAGLLSGRADGTLDPGGSATRAEAAVMLRQLVKLMMQ